MNTKSITRFANYFFAITMPFSHVGGYIAGGIGFLFALNFWKKLRSESLIFWITIFVVYGVLLSLFSAKPVVGLNTMFNYFSHWLLPFILGYSLSKRDFFLTAFWLYYWLLLGLIFFSVLAYFGLFWKSIGSNYLANEGLLKGFKHHIALAALSINLAFLSFAIGSFNENLSKQKKLLFILIGLFLVGAVGLTGSRGYYVASSIGLFVFLIWFTIFQKKYLLGGVVFILLITLSTGIYTISPTVRSRLKSVINPPPLKAYNSLYILAEGGGGGAVVNADRNAIGDRGTFELVDLGNNRVALKAHNGQYVAAEGGGGGAVVNADRNAIGDRETFELVDLGNNRVALKAHNGQYVVAEGGGGGAVNADRNAIGDWETFELVDLGNNRVALKAHNGQYVAAADERFSVSTEDSVTERIKLYTVAIEEIKDKPLFGFGPGQSVYQKKYFDKIGAGNMLNAEGEPKHAHLHSFYLNLTAEFGLIGFLFFAIIFLQIFIKLWTVYKTEINLPKAMGIGLLFGLFTIMVGECFDTHLRGPEVAMDIFWLIGLISGDRTNQKGSF